MSSGMRLLTLFIVLIPTTASADSPRADGNRLTYLDSSDPYYVGRGFPKLTTPQWVGEPGVKAVVILAIDDMRGDHVARTTRVYEAMLRPALTRLEQIDGRGAVSIMTNRIDPNSPQLQIWLKEGVSLETHTYDHPCPFLADGDFGKAKSTYDRCVDLMTTIPGSRAIAFRMPCCDSLNSPSPRFFSGIFDRTTEKENFLHLDSSVFNITTPGDAQLPRPLTTDPDGKEKFRKYVPFDSFVNTIEDYPYPYLINRLCWEFPCAMPSDWEAQRLHQSNNPKTLEDWKSLLDATVIKQGTMTLVFHPHGWIKPEQVAGLVDYADKTYGTTVKFLNFREAFERLNANLLAGQSVRAETGQDNGVRLLDVNGDGYQDVAIGNDTVKKTRVWSPAEEKWIESDFPASLVGNGTRFGIIGHETVCLDLYDEATRSAWRFTGGRWVEDKTLLNGLAGVFTASAGRDRGVRMRDLDGDGTCELIVSNEKQNDVYGFHGNWSKLPFNLPPGVSIVDAEGRDAGLRFVDVDENGRDDLIFSNDAGYALHLFTSMEQGWSKQVLAGKRGAKDATAELPRIVRGDGANNGAWFHSRHMWVQNEDTTGLPNSVDRRSYADLLKDVQPAARPPAESLRSMRPRPGFTVELAAAEPLVMDPINLDFGPDGKLWIVEMGDYPLGAGGPDAAGGRIRILEDTDGDGKYDKSTVFLDGLHYPTGVTAWRKGVIVTCAPDIFYAEDTDGDGKSDKREVLFTGFGEGNQQHRVNGLWYGLDNWLYGANGHSGGAIKSTKTGTVVELGGKRDFRLRPDTGEFDLQSGASQYGRARDDWGNWFGCDNSSPAHHYPIDDRYLRRNPYFARPPAPRVQVADVPYNPPVFPVSRTLARFNMPDYANRLTSGCSLTFYRDDLFGPEFAGNAFLCEPVHNLLLREVVAANGVTFKSHRADDEQRSEFLASTDNWFRPTGMKVGPDGALWVVDMYRLVIEHPEWIPKETQAKLDLRAGHDKGRIYRIYPTGKTPRAIPRLDPLDTAGLVAALDSPSGWQRDTAQRLLVQRHDASAVPLLEKTLATSDNALARLHALCTLDGLNSLSDPALLGALADKHPGVVRHAIRIVEPRLNDNPDLAAVVAHLANTTDAQVRLQLALSLGEWKDKQAGTLLGELAAKSAGEPYLTGAILSSITPDNFEPMVAALTSADGNHAIPSEYLDTLLRMALATGKTRTAAALLSGFSVAQSGKPLIAQFTAVAALIDTLEAADAPLWKLATEGSDEETKAAAKSLAGVFDAARAVAGKSDADEAERAVAVRLLGRGPDDAGQRRKDATQLAGLLTPASPESVQNAAITTLGKIGTPDGLAALLAGWKSFGPNQRAPAADALLARPDWTQAFLVAMENGKIHPTDVDAARRQQLLQHDSPAVRARAAKVFAAVVNPDRQKVIDAFAPAATLAGNPVHGAEVFRKTCATCHRLGEVGNAVGPDLASLSDKSPEYLMVQILDPNRGVEAKFTNYVLQTKSGLTLSGILSNETGSSVTLLAANGTAQAILRSDIKVLRSTGTSLMPENLETGLTPQDLADLMAHIRSAAKTSR